MKDGRAAQEAGSAPAWQRFRSGLVGRSISSVALRGSGAVLGFLFNILISRKLGPSGTGVVIFYLNLASMIGLIATLGMDTVGLRELARHDPKSEHAIAKFGQIFGNAALAVAVFSLGMFAFFLCFGFRLTDAGNIAIYAISTAILGLSALQKIYSDWLIGLQEYVRSQLTLYFINRVGSILLGLVVFFGLTDAMAGETGYLLAYLAGMIAAVAYAFFCVARHFPWQRMVRHIRLSWTLLQEGLNCCALIVAFTALTLSPFILLSWLSTSQEVGFFGVTQRLVSLLVLVLTTISQFSLRELSLHFDRGDTPSLARSLTTSLRLTVGASLALTVPLVALSPWLVLIFGAGFRGAAPALAVMSVGILCQCLGMPFQAILLATGHERLARNIMAAGAVAGTLANALLVEPWGAAGAALGTGLGLALVSAGYVIYVLKVLPVSMSWRLKAVPRVRAKRGGNE